MGKINGCLKCLFIFFNVLFMIIGCLLIYGVFKTTTSSTQLSGFGAPNLGWSWLFAIGVLGISCLGIYAAFSENSIALKVFAGFMGVGMVIMLIFGVITAVGWKKIKENFPVLAAEVAENVMKDEELKAVLEHIQQSGKCCGVVKAQEWGNKIPESCACNTYNSQCVSLPQGARGPDQIYKQSCSEFIMFWVNIACKVAMGIFFTFAVTALLGLLISFLMIHQVKRHDNIGSSIAMRGY